MNLLFLCHAGLDSNSMGHIAGFARPLAEGGHALVVGVPAQADLRGAAELSALRIQPTTFSSLRDEPRVFPDGRGAEIVHAWTPREHVRRAAFDVLRRSPEHGWSFTWRTTSGSSPRPPPAIPGTSWPGFPPARWSNGCRSG